MTEAGVQLSSCLYECRVGHSRLSPKRHSFAYGVYMFYLDLDELDDLVASRRLPLFSRNRFNLFSFYDRDHLKDLPGASLREKLGHFLSEHGLSSADCGRIMLFTYPRILGYVFNPVSFYFVFAPEPGESSSSSSSSGPGAPPRPIACVAEVGNTFHEMKLFYLPEADAVGTGRFELTATKHFYVSPFGRLADLFHFQVRAPEQELIFNVDTLDALDRSSILLSAVSGRRVSLNNFNLFRLFCTYPLVTLKVIVSIHWQALRLWLKKVPFYMKEAEPDLQKAVLNPHKSLAVADEKVAALQ